MTTATRLKGMLWVALASGFAPAFPSLKAETGPAEFNVGQVPFSGNWAGIGRSCWIIVHNRTGQNVNVRFTNKDSTYTGPNWIHVFGDGLGDSYWLQHPNDGGLRFGTHYGIASNSFTTFANADTRVGYEGTVSGFQFDPYNFGGLVDPKSPRYRFQGWGDQPTVSFVERHTVMMEKYNGGGVWEKVGEKSLTWGMTFRPKLVAGSAFADCAELPVFLEFTVGPDFKPAEARDQFLRDPSGDPQDQPAQVQSCGLSGMTTGEEKSVDLSFKLTGDNFGRHPAALRFYQAQIDKTVYDPRLLTVAGLAQVTMSYDATTLAVTQFQTQNDVVVVDDPSATDELFVLKFYVRDPSWTAAPGSPLPVTGTPHTTVTVQNPDRTLQTHNRLNATRVTPEKTETWDYTHTAATSQWVLVSRDGTRTETVVYSPTGVPDVTQEMRTVADENGAPLSKVKTLWQNFSFGSARIEQTVDPDGAALTTTWSHLTDSAAPSSFGRVAQRIDPSGAWIKYTYDATLPEVSKSVQGWLDAPITALESQCRVLERTWNPPGAPGGTALETEKINGIVVSRRFIVEYADGYDEIQCLAQNAAWNDAANLVTKTRYCTDDVFKTLLKSVVRPDGTGMLYSYQIDGTTLDDSTSLTTIVADGALDAGGNNVVDGTQTTTLTNRQGSVVFRQVADILSGKVMDRQLAGAVDDFGRPTSEQFLDGTTQQTTYGCCGIDSRRDRRGILTTYAELTQSHATTQTTLGIITKTWTDGLLVKESRRGTDGSEILLSTSEYNLAGELTSRTSVTSGSAGYFTIVDALGNTVTTTTYADGGTRIDTIYPDGSPVSLTGTAVTPERYEYGVETDGTRWIKRIALDAQGNDTQEWVKSWSDLAGREFRTERSGSGSTTVYFNARGQVERSVDPDGVTTLTTYDARGRPRRTVMDMNRNGVVDDGGTDRITQTDFLVTTRTDGREVERATQTVWTTDNNAAATAVVSTVDRSMDRLDSWVTAGGAGAQSHVANAGDGAWTETLAAGDGSTTVRSYTGGRLASETSKDAGGVTIASRAYAYDAHGRVSQIQDGRGATVTFAYDANDRLHTVTGPAPAGGIAPPVTIIEYDSMGRISVVTDTAGGTITYGYWPTGAVSSVAGNRTYPVSHTYTPQGRLASMTTAGGTTTWVYDEVTGRLWKKLDAAGKGPIHTYTAAGRSASKTNASGIVATYAYDNAGENISITYDDGITPSVTTSYNRLGQPLTVSSGGITTTMDFNAWGQSESETFAGGPLSGLAISRGYDPLRRLSGVTTVLGGETLSSHGYGYDDAFRLKTVSDGGVRSATYGYDPDADLMTRMTLREGGAIRLDSVRSFDLAGRLAWIKSLDAQGQDRFRAEYAYDELDRRTGVNREDGARWLWGYNERGEVTFGGRKLADAMDDPLLQYGYAYDAIGNRIRVSKGVPAVNGPPAGDPHTGTYTPNSLNEYTSRTLPPFLSITGEAAADANVLVQGGPAQRHGTAFWREWSVDNSGGPVRENVRIAAAKPGAGANGADLVSVQAGRLYLAPATESFTYDDDGNLVADSRWTYTWDAESRLIAIEEKPAPLPAGWERKRMEFAYDSGSRRTRKTVKWWQADHWQVVADIAFVYDGWNLIAELDLLQAPSPTLRASYCWGLDLSQSLQGAGGVGGLLWATTHLPSPISHLPSYDGNGNVIGYIDASTGQPVLKLDYDPFGNTVMAASTGDAASSAIARALPFRFSTKYIDRESGLNYYGYRYYSADLGRWISVDPLGEVGGSNLYGFVGNSGANAVDTLGLWSPSGHFYGTYAIARAAGMSQKDAFEFAYYSQLPDQVPALDAFTLWKTDPLGIDAAEFGFQKETALVREQVGSTRNLFFWSHSIQRWLHSLHGGGPQASMDRRCCLASMLKDPSLRAWEKGFINHALGDTFAHQDANGNAYDSTKNGHGRDSVFGIDPDLIIDRPARFATNAAVLYHAIANADANPALLGAVQSWGYRMPTSSGVNLPRLKPWAANKALAAAGIAFARKEVLADFATLPKEWREYQPDAKPYSRLDPVFSVPAANEVEKLVKKMQKNCSK